MSSATRSATTTQASSSVSHSFFSLHVARSSTDLPTGEVGKILGEKWKALGEKQKAPYEAKAAADKKRYEEEKAAYTAVSVRRLH